MKRFTLLTVLVIAHCSSSNPPPYTGPGPLPGEAACDPNSVQAYLLTFDPPNVVVAPNSNRPVRVIINPDVCLQSTLTFSVANAAITPVPMSGQVDLRHATYDFMVPGLSAGKTTITATMLDANGSPHKNTDGTIATATLPVDVRDPMLPACAPADATTGTLNASAITLNGKGTLANASVGSTQGAFTRTDWLGLPTFNATLSCPGVDLTSGFNGYQALSPAVSFMPSLPLSANTPLRREIDFAIPVNPADFPELARMRHLEMLFTSPIASQPRPVTIANPRIESTQDGNYVLRFSSPWFGTYQAVVRTDAGSRVMKRHLMHRAVIGISMGGGGAATFGFHHHEQFDAIAPLGGPSDWTWLGWFVEHYALGGFCTAANPTCTLPSPSGYPNTDTYTHTEDFNHWWYEAGNGNGGHFYRAEYEQIFTDLALQRGNPNGQTLDPSIPYYARGPLSTSPWVMGDTTSLPPNTKCAFTLSPVSTDPTQQQQAEQQVQAQCAMSRCDPSRTFIVPSGYYDADYNPDGSKQVISFCDGNQVGNANNDAASPYENTYLPPSPSQAYPLDLGLAVDLNKNGIRDENEPVIRSGHEPFTDTGTDGLADVNEPGYNALTDPDPNGDDYDPYINPTGTENDHRWEQGEPFLDYGVDGVPNTASSMWDYGEGDGKFTMVDGLKAFYDVDPHSILRGWSNSTDTGALTDSDLARFSVWSDGGVRDLFNFAAVATHLMGAISTRRTSDGHSILPVAFYDNFNMLPGQDITQPDVFVAPNIRWADLAAAPSLRYGTVDATPPQIQQGDGQHVGTGAQILYRIEAAFYYVAQQWPDADRLLTDTSTGNPETTSQNQLCTDSDAGVQSCCEVNGKCEGTFTGTKSGRTGPIAITLPAGYANEDNRLRNVRYPVVYVLHGYGQKPEDLEALQLIANNFMVDGTRSYVSRLGKFIAVYVDGRCREGTSTGTSGTPVGQPECIQGSFYLDSTRPGGALFDTWFDELVTYIDQNYRTMAPTDVTVTE